MPSGLVKRLPNTNQFMVKSLKNKKSLLWEIKSEQSQKPSYIFGTIHLLCEKDFEIKEKVAHAFLLCDTLVMELNLSDPDEMGLLHELSQSQNSLSSQLSAEEKDELDLILKTQYNSTLAQIDNIAPIMVINLMINKAIECEEQKVFEMEFITMAQQNEMRIDSLESAIEQMNIANNIYSPQEIIRQLKEGESYNDLFAQMVTAYQEEDLVKLSKLVSDRRFMSVEAEETLVYGRNRSWVKRMPEIMKDHSVFFAVGAGHLPGSNGILQLLHQSGYAVKPVMDQSL